MPSHAGGGGVSQSQTDMFLRLVDSKIEAGEERVQRSLTEVRAELLGLLNAKSSRGDVWGVGDVIIATMLGVAAVGLGSFDAGVQLQVRIGDSLIDVEGKVEGNIREIDNLSDRSFRQNEKLDRILTNLNKLSEQIGTEQSR